MNAIETDGPTRRFGDIVAVDDVSLTVPSGAVLGLLGPDGAGKSTLIRLLATVLRPDAGQASVAGADVVKHPGRVTPRIGYMSQQFCMYPDLTVAENLEFFAVLRGVSVADRRARAERLLQAMGMAEFTERQAGRLSGGMKQKLMLASTLMHEPDILLLDEPTTGVDPVSRREFWQILASLHAAGSTVLVATPYMDEAERCTHVGFMADGRITRSGTPAEIKASLPGTVWEVHGADPRALMAAERAVPGVRSAHLLGQAVRVFTDDHRNDLVPALRAIDSAADIERISPDMEAVFTYLAEAEERAA